MFHKAIRTPPLALAALSALLMAPVRVDAIHFVDDVRGRIVIDVDQNGEAWYVWPINAERTYLGRPDDAFRVMRERGLGITDADLAKIPAADETFAGDAALRKRLSGRILLQAEANGEAWYVHPVDRKRYFLGRPDDAFRIMRELGLGITHENLLHLHESGQLAGSVLLKVPFVVQAPFGEWSDPRQEEGCEEASALMAMRWVEGRDLTAGEALTEITAMADMETRLYGYHHDTSAEDTASRLFKGYFGYADVEVRHDIGTDDIIAELSRGNLVVAPFDARRLNNPHYGTGGALRHMIVITGYDGEAGQFITNDPGTRYGGSYRYPTATVAGALQDYNSGVYAPIGEQRTAMIVVRPVR